MRRRSSTIGGDAGIDLRTPTETRSQRQETFASNVIWPFVQSVIVGLVTLCAFVSVLVAPAIIGSRAFWFACGIVAVGNLLYALKIKLLAGKAGIESITTEDGQIVIRRFKGVHFDQQKLEPVLRDGIKVGVTRIMISYKKLGMEWREVLEGVLNKVV